MRDIKKIAQQTAAPATHLVATDNATKSYFGGDPQLPRGAVWPQWKDETLTFLARISLPELHRVRQIDWLPADGALLFFYAADEQPWGFDPKDAGSCVVMHVQDLPAPIQASEQDAVEDEDDEGVPLHLPMQNVAFKPITAYYGLGHDRAEDLDLDEDDESEAYNDLQHEPFEDLPKHQMDGPPFAVQGDDMELEAQLASNGLYCGDGSAYSDPRAAQLQAGVADWKLLLQFDSDDDLDVMWGDCGTLYVWIRQQDAKKGDFSNPWLILQCG